MKELAIQKLDKELSELKKPSQHIKVMMQPVHDTLVDFCRQDDEFAQAVYQGGSFKECMEAVAGLGGGRQQKDQGWRARPTEDQGG